MSCSSDQKLSFLFFHFKSSVNVRVVNQLLTEMDGLEARKQVFIMGATNRPGRYTSLYFSGRKSKIETFSKK